jgi:hypothetical protein
VAYRVSFSATSLRQLFFLRVRNADVRVVLL